MVYDDGIVSFFLFTAFGGIYMDIGGWCIAYFSLRHCCYTNSFTHMGAWGYGVIFGFGDWSSFGRWL